ncbi:unnamed protein product [Rotaria sordida]|uniref:Uncharacterized protein n=1 Tax=Rotaria sordida TaxID=392033 RepID=A0A815B258_9BILA|nr:unnamed protein product [Rotaria sordida]
MSDLRCLPKFSFGDIENYIRQKLNEIYDDYGTNDIENSMVREKSYALHSEKGHIMKIVVPTTGTEIRVTSNVKHSMSKKNVCSIKITFKDLTVSDHALQQQELALVNTKFGPTYSISALALQQHDELGKEYTFCIDDYEQPAHPKNADYPPFPLQPLPSLEELKLNYTDIWWPMDIVLNATDCVLLETQTVAQRANQMWRDAHLKRLSASQGLSVQRILPCKQWFLKRIPLLQTFYVQFAIPFLNGVPSTVVLSVFESESSSEEDDAVVSTDISLCNDEDENDFV